MNQAATPSYYIGGFQLSGEEVRRLGNFVGDVLCEFTNAPHIKSPCFNQHLMQAMENEHGAQFMAKFRGVLSAILASDEFQNVALRIMENIPRSVARCLPLKAALQSRKSHFDGTVKFEMFFDNDVVIDAALFTLKDRIKRAPPASAVVEKDDPQATFERMLNEAVRYGVREGLLGSKFELRVDNCNVVIEDALRVVPAAPPAPKKMSIEQRRKEVQVMYDNGKTLRQISEVLGVSVSTISKDLKAIDDDKEYREAYGR